MPFLEDNEPDESALRSPIWSTFVYLKDNLERLVVVNMFWGVQLLPGLLAFAFPDWLIGIRIALALLSATALAASTGVLFGLIKAVCEGEPLTLDLFRDTLRSHALPSMRKLAPLFGTIGACLMVAIMSPLIPGSFLLQVLLYYLLLVLLCCSFYWGPLFADDPESSFWTLFKRSFYLVWRYPGKTLLSWLVILIIVLTGVASIVGVLLIVPVLVSLLQTRRYQEVMERERQRRRRRSAIAVHAH